MAIQQLFLQEDADPQVDLPNSWAEEVLRQKHLITFDLLQGFHESQTLPNPQVFLQRGNLAC